MTGPEIRIRRWGDYCEVASDTLAELKPLLAGAVPGTTLRRVGRFIQLALVGALRCAGDAVPPPGTAVFFTTGRGDFEMTVEMMQALIRDGEPPKPLSLINSVSNAACFYVARQFGLHGANICVGAHAFGFETALQLADLELRSGLGAQALVGTTDIVIPPVAVHRRRLDRAPEAAIGEASHWLWLSADGGDADAAVLAGAELFADRGSLMAWIAGHSLDPAATLFCAGQHLADDGARALAAEIGLARRFDYRSGRPWYDCQAGAAIGAFLASGEGGALLHVNGDAEGRWAAMLVRR